MAKVKFCAPKIPPVQQQSKVGKTVYQRMNLGLCVVTDPYISKRQAEGNVAGAIYKEVNGIVTERPIRGGVTTDFPKALTEMVDVLVKDLGNAAIDSATYTMIEVLKRATSYAPFWFPAKKNKKRPLSEGTHLRGSGCVYIGNTRIAQVLHGDENAATPPDPLSNPGDLDIYWNVLAGLKGKKKSRRLNYTVEFNRIKPTGIYAGFDLATWIHEELGRSYDVGGPKYLERAFNEVKPYEEMQKAIRNLVSTYKYPKSRKSMVRNLCNESIRKLGA